MCTSQDSLRGRMQLLWADSSTMEAGVSSSTTLGNFGLGGCCVTLGCGCCTWEFTFLRKMLARWSSAVAVDLSFSENGAFGAGFWSAAINRCAAAAATSDDVFCGMLKLCGNNLNVWAIRSARDNNHKILHYLFQNK